MRLRLRRRVDRLAARVPPRRAPIPDVDPEWQELAHGNPEARAHAVALSQRKQALWPGREPTSDELFDDEVAHRHWLWLEATKHGGLANVFKFYGATAE